LTAKNAVGKQEQSPDVVGQVESKIDQLALELVEVKIVFAEWDENRVSGGDETPKEKNGDQGAKGSVIGRLFGLAHEAGIWLVGGQNSKK
jgi:hypothetical protein